MDKKQQSVYIRDEEILKQLIKEAISEHFLHISDSQDIIKIDEAMKITHLARQTIYGLIYEKKLPFLPKRANSKKLLFSRAALNNWMKNINEKGE